MGTNFARGKIKATVFLLWFQDMYLSLAVVRIFRYKLCRWI